MRNHVIDGSRFGPFWRPLVPDFAGNLLARRPFRKEGLDFRGAARSGRFHGFSGVETDPLSSDLSIHNRQVSLERAATNAHWDFRTRETPQLITDTPTTLDNMVWVQSPCPTLALIFFVQPSCPGVVEPGSAAKSLKAPPGKAPKTIYPNK